MAIHTHSDFFDLLLGGGLLGLAVYGGVIVSLQLYIRAVPRQSVEFALIGSVGAVFAVMSLITGLLEATYAMFCLGAIVHCLSILAPANSPNIPSGDTMQIERGEKILHRARVILIQAEDPWQHPTGGIVAFTKCLLRSFGDKIAVATPSEELLPVGRWISRSFEGQNLAFFNLGSLGLVQGQKPVVPAKMQVYFKVKKYMQNLNRCGVKNLLLDSAEVAFSAQHYAWDSVCYCFHGLNNPVAQSRYWWARILGYPYERLYLRSLNKLKPDAIIAAADEQTIQKFQENRARFLDPIVIHSFPTRVDRTLFFPEQKSIVRKELGLDLNELILVASGRLTWTKGWNLLLESLNLLLKETSAVRLIFVGDGEDRTRMLDLASEMGLSEHVATTKFLPQDMVRRYLNAADVGVIGSFAEGWSLAMLEMLACGKPIVSTDVSGTAAMIQEGKNGFIIKGRDPRCFAEAIRKASVLPDAADISLKIAGKYSVETLAGDLSRIWEPLEQ